MTLSGVEIAVVKLSNWVSVDPDRRVYEVGQIAVKGVVCVTITLIQRSRLGSREFEVGKCSKSFHDAAEAALDAWYEERPYG